ncbi:MAG: molybdate ABC transporter substrate-binding protein [Coriobacteriia bacterium]|nr:molybdate ABC transporter substrate-binding protein [Coriobacteriia bacterium]
MARVKMVPLKATASVMRALAGGLVAVALLLTGCGAQNAAPATSGSTAPTMLNVSAAASLKSVMTSIAPAFEKANNVKLVFNYGASGVLMKQIEGGTPTDAFLSAAPAQVNTLTADGLISADATETFAGNDLVILVPAGNPKGIHGPGDLSKATKLTTGDPIAAPHGAKAKEWLTNLGLWNTLLPKFVFAANAAQTDDYVARGEVDAGIGFASDAKGRTDLEVAYTVPSSEIRPIKYVAAPIKATPSPALAEKFVTYLLSTETQTALVDAGFKPAPTK